MEEIIRKIYRKYNKNRNSFNSILDMQNLVYKSINNNFAKVSDCEIKSFLDLPGYKIEIDDFISFFPKKTTKNIIGSKKWGLSGLRESFLDVDLIIPPFIQLGKLSSLSQNIKLNPTTKEIILSNSLCKFYPVNSIAAFYTEIYLYKTTFRPFLKQIIESFEAFYQGLDYVAITTLIPCIEGIIRNIGLNIDISCKERIDKSFLIEIICKLQKKFINRIIYKDFDWVPTDFRSIEFFDKFHQIIQMLESMKSYIHRKLYEHSSNLDDRTTLNRHNIIHGFTSNFASSCNFYRLITVLNMLSLLTIISGEKGSFMHPEESIISKELTKHFQLCGNFGSLRKKSINNIFNQNL